MNANRNLVYSCRILPNGLRTLVYTQARLQAACGIGPGNLSTPYNPIRKPQKI